MRLFLPGIVLALFLGCSETHLPTIAVGGSDGARLMNGDARSVQEAYDQAFTSLGRYHHTIRKNLQKRDPNHYAAKVAVQHILENLAFMRSLVTPETQQAMDPYLAKYKKWYDALNGNRWGGSFFNDLNQAEREVKSRFNPHDVAYARPQAPEAETAPAPAAAPPPARTAAAPDPTLPSDRVDLPAEGGAEPAPRAPDSPAPAAPAPAVSPRLLFKAWAQAHEDLVEAYRQKQDCGARYNDVMEALGHMKRPLQGARALKMQTYIDFYVQIHRKTEGFTSLPEKTSAEDIINELKVAAGVVKAEFNPDAP